MLSEQTILSCETIRQEANIKTILIPDHLYHDYEYDKWGNIIHPDGSRTVGELFNDESVQKVLKSGNVLESFRKSIAKWVRANHVQTTHNWKMRSVIKNGLV
jgi:hypothetical protein